MIRLILFLSMLSLTGLSQTSSNPCIKIHKEVDTAPEYRTGLKDLYSYISKDLMPLIYECHKKDGSTPDTIYVALTIDNRGQVADVFIVKAEVTEDCKAAFRQKMLTMQGWKPGTIAGTPVCCKLVLPIKCIKWSN